jgi:hypothetical protein
VPSREINPQTLKTIDLITAIDIYLKSLKTQTYPALEDETCPGARLHVKGLYRSAVKYRLTLFHYKLNLCYPFEEALILPHEILERYEPLILEV